MVGGQPGQRLDIPHAGGAAAGGAGAGGFQVDQGGGGGRGVHHLQVGQPFAGPAGRLGVAGGGRPGVVPVDDGEPGRGEVVAAGVRGQVAGDPGAGPGHDVGDGGAAAVGA